MFSDPDTIPRLLYLVILGVFIGSYILYEARGRIGQTLQMAGLWVLIFIGAVAAYGLKDDISALLFPDNHLVQAEGAIVLRKSYDGHFYADALVNGIPIRFVVDTGASSIALSQQDAEALGIDLAALNYNGRAMTANGDVRTARVQLDSLTLGPITTRNLSASVTEGMAFGSLLGMSYLSKFEKLEISEDRMVLYP